MKAVFFSSLRVRLIFLVLLAIVPALGVICYTAQKQRRLTSVEAQQSGLRLARLVSASQNELVDGTRQLLVALAQIPVVRNGDPVACSALLKSLLAQYTRYANFGVANAEGDLFCSGLPLEGRVNAADRAWFQRAVQTQGFAIGDYQIGRVTRKATINFGYPILGPAGEVKAVAFAALDLAWLNKIAAETRLPAGATITVIDRNGTVLARYPDPQKWVGKSMPEGPLLNSIRAQHNEGTADASGLDGTPRLYGFASLGGGSQGAAVIVGLQRDLAFASADRILVHTMGWLVLILVMAVVGAWLGGNWLVLGQVNRLIRATKQLGGGDLSARVGSPHSNKGELDQVGAAFDQMAGALQARDAEARQLYEQSKQQAAELERINKDLQRREEIEELLKELSQDVTRLDTEALLKKLTEKVREVLRVDVSDVRILKEDRWSVVGLSGVDPVLIPSIREGTSNRRSRWIIESRKPLAVPDTGVEKGLGTGGTMRHLGLRGYLGVPLLSRSGEAVGVLRALTYPPRDFSQDDIDLLQQMANGVAIAVENAQLFEETRASKIELERANQDLKRREEIQKLLKELSQDITTLDLDSLLKKFTERVRELLNVDIADVRVPIEGKWILMGIAGIEPKLLTSARSGTGRGRAGWIQKHRRPLVIPDLSRSDFPGGTTLGKIGVRGYLAVPLFSKGGELIGMLRALTYEPKEFTQEEVDLSELLANGASVALENARLLERIRQQAVELEKANRVKNEFLGFVSHELKTPVNAIKGYIAMMRDKMLGQINSQQEDALNKVMGSSNDLVAMINSLLVATKIEAGAIAVESHEIDLCDFLQDLRSTYGVPLNKELDLIWDYPSDLPTAKSDADKLKHILRNLIDNAIKYTDKGTVTVSARYLPISAAVEFKVRDTGIGIPNEALSSIFEMFSQVNGSEKRAGGGVGLGLHIVKKFTELLGGKIEVQSEPNKGSTFTVTIPYELGAQRLAIEDEVVASEGREEREIDWH